MHDERSRRGLSYLLHLVSESYNTETRPDLICKRDPLMLIGRKISVKPINFLAFPKLNVYEMLTKTKLFNPYKYITKAKT